jgi:hypothetical protein
MSEFTPATPMWTCNNCGKYFRTSNAALDCFKTHSIYIENVTENPADNVNHPPHYTKHPSGVECIQVTEHMNFCIGNAIKYLWRADLKNGKEDLEKAIWYIKREIERRHK